MPNKRPDIEGEVKSIHSEIKRLDDKIDNGLARLDDKIESPKNALKEDIARLGERLTFTNKRLVEA